MNSFFTLIKTAARLINLTDNLVEIYDQCSGEIVRILPESHVLPEQPEPMDEHAPYYYIFEKDIAEQLAENGRALDDIAIVHHRAPGRDNSLICVLVWGKDEHIGVGLCQDLYNKPF